MLKIKDNVDLRKLKCDTPKDDFIWAYKELLFDRDTRIINQNQFYVGGYLTATRLENLYDLIKADLVEKCDNNE
jgi:hypothetical protein